MTDPNDNQNPQIVPPPTLDTEIVEYYYPDFEPLDEDEIEPVVETESDEEMTAEQIALVRQSCLNEFYEWAAARDKQEQKLHINYWMSSRDTKFGMWWMEFKDRQMADPARQLEFYIKLLEAGERERVMVVKQTEARKPFPYHESMGISYSEHLKQLGQYRDRDMYFLDGIGGSIRNTIITSHLCYYDADGRLTQGEINDVGELLEQIRGDELDDTSIRDVSANHPIELYTDWQTPENYRDSDSSLVLAIELKTDIWFPRVCGHVQREIKYRTEPAYSEDATNNLELARCHTPRFNRFLAEVKQLTLEFGGEWSYGDELTSESKADEDGILIPEMST